MRTASIMHWITFKAVSWRLLDAGALRPLLRHVKNHRSAVRNGDPPPELPAIVMARPGSVFTWSLWKASIDNPVMFVFGAVFLLPSVPYLFWGLYRVAHRVIGGML
ncbi:hypothetical protein [Devosia sp.]|uniref:hypothetical protein n=1 Tax=Devosia sp. TaxID=1871048 RepID=UPI002FC72E5E